MLFGRESAGVPDYVHNSIKHRLKIPMVNNKRSLNIASSVAIILSENLRQTNINKVMDKEIKKRLTSVIGLDCCKILFVMTLKH